ncbi:nucleotidyltransferase family protein [Haloarchaeobius sp. HME9146]|uniref:nucleotidyltransferase family protein n=1 Tax=Haloarchaeobius sp. HME9146 TaxID=2978732 RepID=UPI0021BF6681|nr:nucleotidyltransferase domain-containing protein [Haloarchaeobius sp. HME9146]MCT9098218.1 nucleotidyltransferase domain-containing protein [Haloarchaeobius sp. HME9146]
MSDHPDSTPSGSKSRKQPSERVVDIEPVRSVLERHPVSLAVLFGSQVEGTADAQSDIDIVVEFDSVEDTGTAVLRLMSDLSIALDRNDIDLSLVSDLKPRVGRAAFETGILLVGTPRRAAQLQDKFEQQVQTDTSTESLRARFDAALANIDDLVDGEA